MIFKFDNFRLDEERFLLASDNDEVIDITPKALELLLYLVKAPGKLLTKQMIIDEVWGGIHISDTVIPFQVRAIRTALNDTQKPHRIIDTVHGKGLRCLAQVERLEAGDIEAKASNDEDPLFSETQRENRAEAAQKSPSDPKWWMQTRVIAMACAIILAGILGCSILFGESAQSQSEAQPRYDAAIAVMPFTETSANPSEAYLGNGISDSLSSAFSRIPRLKVSSRTSVRMMAADEEVSLAQLREALGVTHVIEGSVLREDNTIRVTVQVADARTDELVWAEIFNLQANAVSLLRMQDTIVDEVVSEVLGKLVKTRAPRMPTTTSQEAYELYLRASAAGSTRTSEGIASALRDLEQAVSLDPQFAGAHSLLALTYRSAYYNGGASDASIYEGVERASRAAMKLDPDDPESLKAASAHERFANRTREEIALLQRALVAAPQDAQALQFLGEAHRTLGQYEESLEYFRRAREVNPLDPSLLSELTVAEFNLGGTQAALEVAEANLRWNPQDSTADFRMGYMDLQMGNYVASHGRLRQAFVQNPDKVYLVAALTAIYLRLGMEEEADKIAASAPNFTLFYHAMTGDQIAFEEMRDKNSSKVIDNSRLGAMYFYLGLFDSALPYELKAIEELEITGPARLGMRETFWNLGRVMVLRQAGNPDAEIILAKIEAALEGVTPQTADSSEAFFSGAGVQMLKGNEDAALDWLEAAFQGGHVFMHLVRNHPLFKSLSDNPRYLRLQTSMLVKAQEYREEIEDQLASQTMSVSKTNKG